MDIGPSMRRFFINTLFDSTFTLLGVIVGSAFVAEPEIEVILGTMITISLGLGISSGASVYQAESLEREREVHELEKAMLTNLKDTKNYDLSKKHNNHCKCSKLINTFPRLRSIHLASCHSSFGNYWN